MPAAHFQYRRTPRDRLWALLFALAWVAAVVGGVYAIKHRNPAFIHLDYSDPASCPAHPDAARALLEALHEKHKGDWSPSQFVQFTGQCAAAGGAAAAAAGAAAACVGGEAAWGQRCCWKLACSLQGCMAGAC